MFIIVEEKNNRNSYRISNKYEKRINKLKTDSESLTVIFLFVIFPILFMKELFKLIFDVILWVIKFLLKLTSKVFKITEYSTSEEILNPRHMLIEDMEDYLKSNYLGKEFIKKDKIINDLVIFKTLRDELEISIRNNNIFSEFISSIITVFIAIATSDYAKEEGFLKSAIIIFLGYTFIKYAMLIVITGNKSDSKKLVCVNKIIYTLESIKDNLVEVPETKKFEVEVDNVVDQVSEPRKYSVKVKESLEDKSK